VTECSANDDPTGPERRLLPLLSRRTHGRSAIGCRYKCRDACSRPAPNPSDNGTFREIAAGAVSRRQILRAGAVLGLAGFATAACSSSGPAPSHGPGGVPAPPGMQFTAVAPNTADGLTVPPGYQQQVVIRWGDPVLPLAPPFDPATQTAAAQAMQFGFNNDYLTLLALPGDPGRAVLVANHEYTNEPFMHARYDENAPTREQIEIGFAAHGLSVVMVDRDPATGRITPRMDPMNRRITGRTPMALTGPAAGDALVRTSADPEGRTVLGTLYNCSGGLTPWNTVLTGEENFDGYFANGATVADPASRSALARYGMDQGASERKWETVDARFELTREPNEANRFGWVVEIDPFDPASTPRKRTALGRFKHEAANPRVSATGVPTIYMGDDEKFEYVYKFVAAGQMRPGSSQADREANGRLLDVGTLYAARFTGDSPDPTATPPGDGEFDGAGEWLPLVESLPDGTGRSFVPGMTAAQVLVNTRQAGDIVGATKMDRPEDVQHPITGRVYVALTNNDERGLPGKAGPDEANPRAVNKNGQVLELTEESDDPAARRFGWKLLLVCGDPAAADTYYGGFPKDQVSPISCPDNIAFDPAGNLWIATDGNELGSNDGLFAVALEGDRRGMVKQFLTVPKGAETCGPVVEERMVLVAVQHPGESDDGSVDTPTSHWPDGGTAIARPAVVAVRRSDGGPIGT